MPFCRNCGARLSDDSSSCSACDLEATAAEQTSLPSIRGYRILQLLGEGGMGAVYLAEEEALGRKVALKLIAEKFAATGDARARFIREARSMATVEHPNIVRLYAFGEVDGKAFLVMEYVDGESLADRLKREKTLAPAEAIRLSRQIAEALDAAWEKRIVHRDIKPSNILIDRRGRARVADFGLAKPVDAVDESALTQSSAIVGTPHYISPEQIHGKELTCQSDIYSLGIMLYEMLTGEKPFQAATPLGIVDKHLHTPFPTLAGKLAACPPALAQLVRMMTQKDPADRPRTYAGVIEAIDAISNDRPLPPSLARTIDLPPESRPSSGSPIRKWALPALAAAVAFAAAATLSIWNRHPPAPDREPITGGATPASAPEARLSVAVVPFYGPDEDSAKEGRVMAALVEKSIRGRLGKDEAIVYGIEETKQPVRDHDAARALGKKLGANAVIWGETIALRGESNVQPYFTIVPPEPPPPKPGELAPNEHANIGDPLSGLREQAPSLVVQSAAPNQFELRRTSASGVGDMVMLLAGVHALYRQGNAAKALRYLQAAPATPETLRHRSLALLKLGRVDEAVRSLREAEKAPPEPGESQSYADAADALLEADQLGPAVEAFRRALTSEPEITTHFGTLFEGKLYAKEAYRYVKPGERFGDTTYLLALDPTTGRVLARHNLPGAAKTLRVRGGSLVISYRDSALVPGGGVWKSDEVNGPLGEIGLAGDVLDRPVFPTPNLLLRFHSLKNPRRIAGNFLEELESVKLTPDTPPPLFRLPKSPGSKLNTKYPVSLPELETALRSAIARDATQPWYLLFLGQAQSAEGRREEATATWGRIFGEPHPAIPYYDYSWMASWFERMGERSWADQAYAEALRRRRLIPQPIDSGLLIERLISARFMMTAAMASARGRDLPRQYAWLLRTREIAGVCTTQGEASASAAWQSYFQARGDYGSARREAVYREALSRAPINFAKTLTESDIALYVCAAAFIALWWVVGKILIAPQVRRIRWARKLEIARTAAVILLGGSLAIGLTGLALDRSGAPPHPYWTAVQAIVTLALLAGAFSALRNRGFRAEISSLSLAERLAIAGVTLLFVAAAGGLAGAIERRTSISKLPIGGMDGFGNPRFAEILESSKDRLGDSPEMRYCLAVASQMAGDRNRARNLYASIPDDPRARENLAALEKGAIQPIHPLRDADVADALTAGMWGRALRRFLFWRPIQPSDTNPGEWSVISWIEILVFPALLWTMVGAILLLGVILAVKGSGATALRSPGSLASSVGTAILLSFALPPMLFQILARPALPALGLYGRAMMTDFHLEIPYPNPATVKTEAAALRYHYWTSFWAIPYAKPFWAAVVISLIVGIVLAVAAFRTRRRSPSEAP